KQGRLNDAKDGKAFSFHVRDPRYQLRAYIWNLFRGYDIIQEASLRAKPPWDWAWIDVLSHLLADFRLLIVSFNYDVNIERLIAWAFRRRILVLSMGASRPATYGRFKTSQGVSVQSTCFSSIAEHGRVSL